MIIKMPENPFPVVAFANIVELYLHGKCANCQTETVRQVVAQRYAVQVSDTTMMNRITNAGYKKIFLQHLMNDTLCIFYKFIT